MNRPGAPSDDLRMREELADDAAAEADGDGVGPRAGLQLREQVAHVGLDRLLRQEEPDADLAIDETVRDQLEDLDLPHRGLLLQLPQRALERDDLGAAVAAAPARRDLLEATRVIHVAVEDLLTLCCVHGPSIGVG